MGLLDVLERSRARGFLGPGPVEAHVEHAEAFAAAAGGAPDRLLDLGSGGGLPGLVLADRWPATAVVLVDAQARRTSFLAEAVAELGWSSRVEVVTGRAEELGRDDARRHRFDLVVARSFGPPAVVAECGAPFLAVGGRLLVSEPPGDPSARWPASGLAELGLTDDGLFRTTAAGIRLLRAVAPCGPRYPRRVGIPAKRPLFPPVGDAAI